MTLRTNYESGLPAWELTHAARRLIWGETTFMCFGTQDDNPTWPGKLWALGRFDHYWAFNRVNLDAEEFDYPDPEEEGPVFRLDGKRPSEVNVVDPRTIPSWPHWFPLHPW